MNPWADTIAVSLVMTGFLLLGSSRISACIRFVALQGLLLALLTLAAPDATLSWATALLVLTTAGVKGFLLPWLLLRALRDVDVRREVDPLISYNLSIVAGALILGVSVWLSGRLPLPGQPPAFLLVPSAIFTSLTGLFLLVSRRTALTQVIGYLALENGIYEFGVSVVQGTSMLVELGVLLDLLVAVFVMGITIFHINRQFDHIDTDRLASLNDWTR